MTSEYECERCGASYLVGVGGDPFTTITVSFHDDARADFAVSVCQACGDDLLTDVYDLVDDTEVPADG